MNKHWKELDKVKVSEYQKEEIFNTVMSRAKSPVKQRSPMRFATLLLTSMAALLIGFNVFRLNLVDTQATIGSVALDTTSMIVLEVDEKNEVISVTSSSVEDQALLQSLGLVGKDLEEAMLLVVEYTAADEPKLNVYLYSEDDHRMQMMDNAVQQVFEQTNNGERHCTSQRMNSEEWENMMNRENSSNGHRRRRMHE